MGRSSRLALAAGLAGATLALGACSGAPSDPGASGPSPAGSATSDPASSSAPSPAPTSAAPTAAPTASPSLQTLPATRCLTGTWRLVRFVAESKETYGTGEGGDVTVRFDKGSYALAGAGAKPVRITLSGQTANLTVDGKASGRYRLDGSTATFTSRSASGSGTVELGGQQRRLTMDQVTNVVGLQGDGQVACTADAMTITLRTVRLELGRT